MDLEGLSPLDKLARARMSTVSLTADSPILAEMPPPFELFRSDTPSARKMAPKHAPQTPRDIRPPVSPSPTAHSIPSPAPSRSTTLTSENLELHSQLNDSCQTLAEEDFDWSEKSTSKTSLLSWLQTQPPESLPFNSGIIRHGASRSWDLSHSSESCVTSTAAAAAATKHQKSNSLWGYSTAQYDGEQMLTPPPLLDDVFNVPVCRGAQLVESGDKEAGIKSWRAAKDAGNIYGQLLYFLAVDAGWIFDAAHPDLGSLVAKVNPQALHSILGGECPHIADAFYGFSTRQEPSLARKALTLAAAINSAGRPSQ